MTQKDFSTCSESDAGSVITVSSTSVSWANLQRDTTHGEHYVVCDYGQSFFGSSCTLEFEYQFKNQDNSAEVGICAVSNDIGDMQGFSDSGASHWIMYFYRDATSDDILYLQGLPDGTTESDKTIAASGTSYYATLIRSGASIELFVYDDSERTQESCESLGATIWNMGYRYLYPLISRGRAPPANQTTDGLVAYMDVKPDINNYSETLSDILVFSDGLSSSHSTKHTCDFFTLTSDSGTAITFNIPQSISWTDSRGLQHFHFWSGGDVVFDIGKNAETLAISTIAESQAFSDMATLDGIIDDDEEITLSGFGEVLLDTTWVISEYQYSVEGGIPNVVKLMLTLEKT